MTRPSDAGFTLLEILVALVVLGFILAGLSEGTRFGLRAAEMQTRSMEAFADLDAADRALRRLIEQADPGTPREAIGPRGEANRLAMTTELPEAAGLDGRRADIVLEADPAGNLVLHWAPNPHIRRFAAPPAPQTITLLAGVDHIEFTYWSTEKGGWLSTWTVRDNPALVRLRIVFAAATGRHWPDIVAAPLRRRLPG